MKRTFAYLIIALLLTAAAMAIAGFANAQEADHPSDKPMVVASDFGVAPWMVRGASGPEEWRGESAAAPFKSTGH
jgi:polar amino acid transport system substrate-binding protein